MIKFRNYILMFVIIILISFVAVFSNKYSNFTTTDSSLNEITYIYEGSINSDIYHNPSCERAKRIKKGNIVKFNSLEDAKSKGYKACKVCKP